MGWKSTINLTRSQAITAILSTIKKTPYDNMTNDELTNIMYGLDMGDDTDKPYYGHNFNIVDDE